jgi:hypothetical protein
MVPSRPTGTANPATTKAAPPPVTAKGKAKAPALPPVDLSSVRSSFINTVECKNTDDRNARVKYIKDQMTSQLGKYQFVMNSHSEYRHSCLQIATLDIKWSSDSLFPWKMMASELAKSGVVLHNWPHGVRFPGESTAKEKSKGIAGLSAAEQLKLLNAFTDAACRLYFERFDDADRRQGEPDSALPEVYQAHMRQLSWPGNGPSL